MKKKPQTSRDPEYQAKIRAADAEHEKRRREYYQPIRFVFEHGRTDGRFGVVRPRTDADTAADAVVLSRDWVVMAECHISNDLPITTYRDSCEGWTDGPQPHPRSLALTAMETVWKANDQHPSIGSFEDCAHQSKHVDEMTAKLLTYFEKQLPAAIEAAFKEAIHSVRAEEERHAGHRIVWHNTAVGPPPKRGLKGDDPLTYFLAVEDHCRANGIKVKEDVFKLRWGPDENDGPEENRPWVFTPVENYLGGSSNRRLWERGRVMFEKTFRGPYPRLR
jgi:hypothetical protein